MNYKTTGFMRIIFTIHSQDKLMLVSQNIKHKKKHILKESRDTFYHYLNTHFMLSITAVHYLVAVIRNGSTPLLCGL